MGELEHRVFGSGRVVQMVDGVSFLETFLFYLFLCCCFFLGYSYLIIRIVSLFYSSFVFLILFPMSASDHPLHNVIFTCTALYYF